MTSEHNQPVYRTLDDDQPDAPFVYNPVWEGDPEQEQVDLEMLFNPERFSEEIESFPVQFAHKVEKGKVAYNPITGKMIKGGQFAPKDASQTPVVSKGKTPDKQQTTSGQPTTPTGRATTPAPKRQEAPSHQQPSVKRPGFSYPINRQERQGLLFEHSEQEIHYWGLRKRGLEAIGQIDKMVKEAVNAKVEFEYMPTSWDDLLPEEKDDAFMNYLDDNYQNTYDSALDEATEEYIEYLRDNAFTEEDSILESARDEFHRWLVDHDFNPDWADYLERLRYDGTPVFNTSNDEEFAEFLEEYGLDVEKYIQDQATQSLESRVEEVRNNPLDFIDGYTIDTKVRDILWEQWNETDDSDKMSYVKDRTRYWTVKEPAKYLPFEAGDSESHKKDKDYNATRMLSLYLQFSLTKKYFSERGQVPESLKDEKQLDVAIQENISSVWEAWKESSTSDVGLALQLVAAMEFGGYHRLQDHQIDKAVHSLRGFGARLTDKVPLDAPTTIQEITNPPPGKDVTTVLKEILSRPPKTVGEQLLHQGYAFMSSMVRGTWETTQYILNRAGVSEAALYRAVMLPGDLLNKERTERVAIDQDPDNPASYRDAFTKLPDLVLKKNGAASTAYGKAGRLVANAWKGVGSLPTNPERVVIRVLAPAEAMLSIPCYGQNVHEEREVVVLGTYWKAWDAWHRRAPGEDE
ncbi:MAG: hypothetical protein QXI19_13330, partial [Candidatus Caldarchaeum sp.]